MAHAFVTCNAKLEQIATLEQSLDRKEDEAASIIASLTEHLQTAEEKFRNAQSAILSKDGELEKGEGTAHFLGTTSVALIQDTHFIHFPIVAARVSELRSEISSLQQQLSTQYSESQNSIKLLQESMQAYKAEKENLEQSTQDMESLRQQIASQELNWKDKLGKSESENDDLKRRLQQLDVQLRELHELRETVSQDEEIVRQWESRASDLSQTVATLEQKVESLQSDLAQQEHDAVNAIAVWEENFSDLEAKFANLEAEILHFNETISCRDWSIEQLKANNEGLTLRVEELMTTAQIRSSMEEDLIQGSTEISRLTEVLENERQIRISEREKIEAELASERGKHAEARDEIETLTYLLEENKTESETLINQWTGKIKQIVESV
jgi:chromosome segregation ATPase